MNFWLANMFYQKKLVRKSCYSEKIWIFAVAQIIKSTDWHCKETIAIHPKLCGNCTFPQNSHTRKLGEIRVFYVVIRTISSKLKSLNAYNFFRVTNFFEICTFLKVTLILNSASLLLNFLMKWALNVF